MKECPALQTRLHLRMYVMPVQRHDAILHATLGIGLLGSPEPTWRDLQMLAVKTRWRGLATPHQVLHPILYAHLRSVQRRSHGPEKFPNIRQGNAREKLRLEIARLADMAELTCKYSK